jgi:hypothetical protein
VTGATLSDSVPLTVTNVIWTCSTTSGSSCGVGGAGNGLVDTLNLLNGGAATYTIIGAIAPAAQGLLTDMAAVTLPVDVTDPVLGNNSATVTTVIVIIPVTGGNQVYLPVIQR